MAIVAADGKAETANAQHSPTISCWKEEEGRAQAVPITKNNVQEEEMKQLSKSRSNCLPSGQTILNKAKQVVSRIRDEDDKKGKGEEGIIAKHN